MSAHGLADSHDPEAASAKMDSPSAVNGNDAVKNGQPDHPVSSPLASKAPSEGDDADMKSQLKKESIGGDIVVKQESGQPPKLARSSSQKVVRRPPQLFLHLPDSTEDALATFEPIESCWYANKYMGYTEHAMECDCAEEWGKVFSPVFPFCCLFNDHVLHGRE